MRIIILLITLLFGCQTFAQIEGTWNGFIEIPMSNLAFVLHVSREDGLLKVTSDSPDQGVFGIELQEARFENNRLYLKDSRMMMSYEGELTGDNSINGNFKQGAQSFKLNLTKGEFKRNRPQEPKAPFSYKSEDIVFDNKAAGIKLSGTLTLPAGKGKFPAVVLVSGSGPQDRDEEILGHKPFMVIADYLTKNGYAVLRYDDRGVAASGGDFASATVFDFSADTEAAIAYLKTRKDIDTKKIGILGHSEGGQVAQIIAAKDASLKFIILLASPGIKGSDVMILQTDAIGKSMQLPEYTRSLNKELNTRTYEIVMRNEVKDNADRELAEYYKTTVHYKGLNDEQLQDIVEGIYTPHIRQLLVFDPMVYLPRIKCNVLALNGTKDLQVTSTENLAGISAGLQNKDKLHTVSYPGLNHLFQPATTGLPDEYGTIETTIETKVLEDITNWLNKNAK